MPTIDLCNWCFSLGGSPAQLAGTEHYQPPDTVEIGTPIELLKRLSNDATHETAIQNQIQQRLKSDPKARDWHAQRTRIGATTHFKAYRRNPRYEQYHAAARAVATGKATSDQQGMVSGLDGEIGASKIVVPAGQVLFHGRGDMHLHEQQPYPTFVSASLDPTVCSYHATKRKLQNGMDAKAVIYLLTLRDALPAMWGNGGDLDEWELLLQSGLTCTMTAVHDGQRFDIVEATIGV